MKVAARRTGSICILAVVCGIAFQVMLNILCVSHVNTLSSITIDSVSASNRYWQIVTFTGFGVDLSTAYETPPFPVMPVASSRLNTDRIVLNTLDSVGNSDRVVYSIQAGWPMRTATGYWTSSSAQTSLVVAPATAVSLVKLPVIVVKALVYLRISKPFIYIPTDILWLGACINIIVSCSFFGLIGFGSRVMLEAAGKVLGLRKDLSLCNCGYPKCMKSSGRCPECGVPYS